MRTRQAVLIKPRKFKIRENDITPDADELLIEIKACGLCKWELNHWMGLLGECPQTLGHEIAGIVKEVGSKVTKFKVGDAVTSLVGDLAGFAEYCIVAEDKSVMVSPDVDIAGALGEPLSCVVTTLDGASPVVGDIGVIVGCGPMGLWCIQALAGGMLSGLVAVDVSDEKLALAKKFGATHTINPRNQDGPARVREISGGHMADFVIDGTGVTAVFGQLHEYLKVGRGRLIMMSSHEKACKEFDWRPLQAKGTIVHVTHPGYAVDQVDNLRRAIALYNVDTFRMEKIITHKFNLDDIQQAFETLENPPVDYNKGVVIP